MRAATLVSRLLNYPFTGPAALFRNGKLAADAHGQRPTVAGA
jgi:hypothetical protein